MLKRSTTVNEDGSIEVSEECTGVGEFHILDSAEANKSVGSIVFTGKADEYESLLLPPIDARIQVDTNGNRAVICPHLSAFMCTKIQDGIQNGVWDTLLCRAKQEKKAGSPVRHAINGQCRLIKRSAIEIVDELFTDLNKNNKIKIEVAK